MTHEVYGYVVALDAFGLAQLVPMYNVMEQIRETFSPEFVSILKTIEADTNETPLAKTYALSTYSKAHEIPQVLAEADIAQVVANDTKYQPTSGRRDDNLPSYGVEDDQHGEQPLKIRSNKEKYALALQKVCATAIDRVKSNNMIKNSPLAASLVAAPNAIATMAILFKVADREEASGLEVDSLDIIDIGSIQGGGHPKAANARSTANTAEDGRSPTESAPGAFSQDDEAPTSDELDDEEPDIQITRVSPPVGRVVGRLP